MQRISTLEPRKDDGVEGCGCAQPREHETESVVANAQVALKLIKRRARRLRSAEAQVADLRLALGQEISRTIDTTGATLSDIAHAGGLSVQAVHGAIERGDACHQEQRAAERGR